MERAPKLTLRPRPRRNTFRTLRSWTLPPISLPHSPTRPRQVQGHYEMRQKHLPGQVREAPPTHYWPKAS